jgi:hypothetical protein
LQSSQRHKVDAVARAWDHFKQTTNLSLIAIGRDEDQLNVFVREETASAWFTEHDPEGVPFEHPVYAA